LLAALLGEPEVISGKQVSFNGKISYAAQQPWILNGTVETNIMFGAEDKGTAFYNTVVDKCCLKEDFNILPAGDQTEIGERGVNLSGGQKARIALARVAYRDADLYLFDDPLAAVDAHVGQRLVTEVLGNSGMLAGKTRILVTHQVQYLPQADRVVVMSSGEITAVGTYAELIAANTPGIEVQTGRPGVEEEETGEAETKAPNLRSTAVTTEGKQINTIEKSGEGGDLVKDESAAEGAVGFATYIAFLKNGFGPGVTVCLGFGCMMTMTLRVLVDFFLAAWTDGEPFGLDSTACIAVYCCLGVGLGVVTYVKALLLSAIGFVRACRSIYSGLYKGVFGSPVVFFDTTPTGRILNRFTADMDIIDNQLTRSFFQVMNTTETCVASLFAIAVISPVVIVVMIPIVMAFGLLQKYYRYASRDVQRLEAITKTPIFNRVSETLSGLSSIKAFRLESIVTDLVFQDISDNQACNIAKVMSNCWLSLRLELLSLSIATASAAAVFLPFGKGPTAAFAGIGLVYCLELSKYVQAFARFSAELEQRFTSPERIFEYSKLPQEQDIALVQHAAVPKPAITGVWPSAGAVEYKAVTMRYRPELEPALRGLTFSIAAGEKLGVVGRTGSGKSSIIVTLLRLTEFESGSILIDGVDTRGMPLAQLRRSIAMIPQEPVLFGNMTLGENLDPFGEASQEALQEAVTKVQMSGSESLVDGLQTLIAEGGASFSVGQRQLLCLARAVLRRSKLILLDEATASVDGETDLTIQRTVRETFHDSTVFCIAHRIRTILDSDKVLVMNEGKCAELGTPSELLATSDSNLRALAIQSGIDVPTLD
jgi:ABC-type multidrug transport system fused ATPase/permease subunit